MKKIFVLIALVSACSVHGNEVPQSLVTYIAPWTPWVDIKVESKAVDPESCGAKGFYRIDLVNDTGASAKLSVILSAYHAKLPVGLSIKGCVGTYPKIVGVRLGAW